MKKNNFKIIKIDKNKSLFNYEKKILINELVLDLKLGYYDFEKEKSQRIKFSLEIDYEDKKPTNDKDIKSIVNYGTVVKLITKLDKNLLRPTDVTLQIPDISKFVKHTNWSAKYSFDESLKYLLNYWRERV